MGTAGISRIEIKVHLQVEVISLSQRDMDQEDMMDQEIWIKLQATSAL